MQIADDTVLNFPDGTDDNLVFETEETYQEEDVQPDNERMMDVDGGLQEVFETEDPEDLDSVLDDHILKYAPAGEMSSTRWRSMSER